jgi:hypothetical protein
MRNFAHFNLVPDTMMLDGKLPELGVIEMSIFHYYFNKCDPQFHHSLHVVQSTAAIVEFINQNSNAFQLFSAKIYYTAHYWTSYIEL